VQNRGSQKKFSMTKLSLILALSFALTAPAIAITADAPLPDSAVNKFIRRLGNANLPNHSGVTLIDLATGQTLHQHRGDHPFVPASTMKLVTAVVALKTFGSTYKFETEATWNSESKNLYLVGGGDPTLQTSHLEVLADGIATSLGQNSSRISLYSDASLFPKFTKPSGWNPNPMPRYVRDIYSLSVDGLGSYNSPQYAGKKLAKILKSRGYKIKYVGAKKSDGEQIATTYGFSLFSTVRRMLQDSDNTIAETLFRVSAAASGDRATWENSRAYAFQVLTELGVDTENIRIIDGSGLSRTNRLTTHFLTSLLMEIVDPENPELNVIYDRRLLPTAGRNGTLKLRFSESRTLCARGLVHAKTGSLRDTDSLAGYVENENGGMAIFAFLVNHGPNWYVGNRVRHQMDWIVSSATGCN
jgi:D-alanyl-D-alanine carboxypeptidase/D-alanyl-D-alanine-endopeptidase (penicillin-binding protein 4)